MNLFFSLLLAISLLLGSHTWEFEVDYTPESLAQTSWVNTGTKKGNDIIGLKGTVKNVAGVNALCYDQDSEVLAGQNSGIIDYIYYNTNSWANPELTMIIWVNPKVGYIPKGKDWLLGHDDGGYDRSIIVYDNRYGGIAMGTGRDYQSHVSYPTAGVFTSIAATFSKSNGKATVYKNGGAESQTVSITSDTGGMTTIGLNGLHVHRNHYFVGCIGRVQIINRVLTPQEIKQVYNNGLSTNEDASNEGKNGIVGFGETCTLSMGNAEAISAATGVAIDIISKLVGLIPGPGAFGSAVIDIAKDPSVNAIEQAIKDGAIICEEGLWCCDNKCKILQRDWANIAYCPNECKAGPLCPNGSCGGDSNRGEYKQCCDSRQCAGSMTCCSGQCRNKLRDWANIPYCPNECRGGADCGPGTCPSNRGNNQACGCDGQCSSGCCENGKCVSKQKDWAGVYYCPRTCKGGVDCGRGTCPSNRGNNQACGCDGQCSSGCCENGKCVSKQRDWAGVYYCPRICRGGAGCGAGTCPNNRGNSQSCGCDGQCSSGCCENGKCVSKKKDWAGFYYCPRTCRGCWVCGAGTC